MQHYAIFLAIEFDHQPSNIPRKLHINLYRKKTRKNTPYLSHTSKIQLIQITIFIWSALKDSGCAHRQYFILQSNVMENQDRIVLVNLVGPSLISQSPNFD